VLPAEKRRAAWACCTPRTPDVGSRAAGLRGEEIFKQSPRENRGWRQEPGGSQGAAQPRQRRVRGHAAAAGVQNTARASFQQAFWALATKNKGPFERRWLKLFEVSVLEQRCGSGKACWSAVPLTPARAGAGSSKTQSLYLARACARQLQRGPSHRYQEITRRWSRMERCSPPSVWHQQVKGGSAPLLLCPGESPSAVLCPVLGSPL